MEDERKERYFAYWLSRVSLIGAVKAGKLLKQAGSYEAIYNMKKEHLDMLSFLREPEKQLLWEARELFSLLLASHTKTLRYLTMNFLHIGEKGSLLRTPLEKNSTLDLKNTTFLSLTHFGRFLARLKRLV